MGELHRSVSVPLPLPEDHVLQSEQQAQQPKAFSSRRAMVAYRDGQLYVDTKRDVAYFSYRRRLQNPGVANREPSKGG